MNDNTKTTTNKLIFIEGYSNIYQIHILDTCLMGCSYRIRVGPLNETTQKARFHCVDIFIVIAVRLYMDKRAGPVAEISLERREISLTGMKISP